MSHKWWLTLLLFIIVLECLRNGCEWKIFFIGRKKRYNFHYLSADNYKKEEINDFEISSHYHGYQEVFFHSWSIIMMIRLPLCAVIIKKIKLRMFEDKEKTLHLSFI